jgi:hypothetical protein
MGEAEILDRLFHVIEARRLERPEGSYVVELLEGGRSRLDRQPGARHARSLKAN